MFINNKPPRQLCQICERRRLVGDFTTWGHTEQICKDCEREIMRDDPSDPISAAAPPAKPSIKTRKKAIPYDEIDANMVSLVRALNRYPGVLTLGSCGGHDVVTNPSQWEAGTWYVKFTLPTDRSGWYLLEHLAWAINNDYRRGGGRLMLLPISPPPYLNTPGECLSFSIEGFGGENPEDLATFLVKVRKYLTRRRY